MSVASPVREVRPLDGHCEPTSHTAADGGELARPGPQALAPEAPTQLDLLALAPRDEWNQAPAFLYTHALKALQAGRERSRGSQAH